MFSSVLTATDAYPTVPVAVIRSPPKF